MQESKPRTRTRTGRTPAARACPRGRKRLSPSARSCAVIGWFEGHQKMSQRCQTPEPQVGPAHCPHHQRRAPSTPPLPLRSLQLVPKRPETPVVFREGRKVRGQGSGARDSWPGAGSRSRMSPSSLLAPPLSGQPVIKAWPQTRNRAQLSVAPSDRVSSASQNPRFAATPHPHWSVPVITPTRGRGSEATLMALLLFCHR